MSKTPHFVSRSKVPHHRAEVDLAKHHGEHNYRISRRYFVRAVRRQGRREIAASLAVEIDD